MSDMRRRAFITLLAARQLLQPESSSTRPAVFGAHVQSPFITAVDYFTTTPGQKIAVLGNDTGTGTLSVTEMS
jgi:hypothetical protein